MIVHDYQEQGKIRSYSFAIVSYDVNADYTPFFENVNKYIYIKHDRDDASPHLHIGVTVSSNKTCIQIVDLVKSCCNVSQNVFCQPIENKLKFVEYLQHLNEEGKYKYDRECIVTNSDSYWFGVVKQEFDNETFVNDLLELSLSQMCVKYGMNFMRNYHQFSSLRSDLLIEELRDKHCKDDEKDDKED